MRVLWLTTVVAAACACELRAVEIDEEFLPSIAFMACGISPDSLPNANGGMGQRAFCSAVEGICKDEPDGSDCEALLVKFHVRELAEDRSFVLYTAASVGNVPIMTAMLAEGVDPDGAVIGQPGWTALMIAAAEGQDAAVSALLAAGADPNRTNSLGRTALMFASSYGFTALARELLDYGADANLVPPDASGWTALIAAACAGRVEVTQLLLERGANAAVEDRNGNTALECAQQKRHSDVARVLRARKPK